MPDFNTPADLASVINDLQRRVRVLESMRVVQPDNSTIPPIVDPLVPSNWSEVAFLTSTVRPTAYDGALRTTGTPLAGGPAVALPAATIDASMFIAIWVWNWGSWSGTGPAGTYYASSLAANLRVDGVPTGNTVRVSTATEVVGTVSEFCIGVYNPGAGLHSIECEWSAQPSGAGAPTTHARMLNQALVVTPLRLT